MKYKKIMALVVAVITITMAFAPAAMAVTYAPSSWSSWPLQKENSYNTMFTKAIQIYCNRYVGSSLTIDGVYGPKTYEKVVALQSRIGLAGTQIDGKVGSTTWGKMRTNLFEYANNTNVKAYRIKLYDGSTDTYTTYQWNKSTLHWYTAVAISGTAVTYSAITY